MARRNAARETSSSSLGAETPPAPSMTDGVLRPPRLVTPAVRTLRRDVRCGLLSPSHQFELLAKAVEEESPTKAAAMREWSAAAQGAMLKWLTDVTDEHPNPTNQIELWRVRKGERELRCQAHYLPVGIDVRLMEGADFRRTQLVRA